MYTVYFYYNNEMFQFNKARRLTNNILIYCKDIIIKNL